MYNVNIKLIYKGAKMKQLMNVKEHVNAKYNHKGGHINAISNYFRKKGRRFFGGD